MARPLVPNLQKKFLNNIIGAKLSENAPSSPGDSVQVSVCVLRHVVVEDDVDSLDVHPAAEQVGGDQDPLLEILELLVPKVVLL